MDINEGKVFLKEDGSVVFWVFKNVNHLADNELLIESNTFNEWFEENKEYENQWEDFGMSHSWEDEVKNQKQLALCREKLIYYMPQYEGFVVTPENREKIVNYI